MVRFDPPPLPAPPRGSTIPINTAQVPDAPESAVPAVPAVPESAAPELAAKFSLTLS